MQTNFAIVCMGRTGSTMLTTLLDSHPDIECRGELFGQTEGFKDHPGLSRREFLERHAYQTQKPIKGFKMPLDWIFNHPGIFEDFRALRYKIVRLNRANRLEHLVSIKLADINKNWSSTQYEIQKTPVAAWELISFIGNRNAWNAILDKFAAQSETLSVSYEKLFDQSEQNRLLAFLGASPAPLTTTTIRQRTIPLVETIENYDELSSGLAKTPFAHLAKYRAA